MRKRARMLMCVSMLVGCPTKIHQDGDPTPRVCPRCHNGVHRACLQDLPLLNSAYSICNPSQIAHLVRIVLRAPSTNEAEASLDVRDMPMECSYATRVCQMHRHFYREAEGRSSWEPMIASRGNHYQGGYMQQGYQPSYQHGPKV